MMISQRLRISSSSFSLVFLSIVYGFITIQGAYAATAIRNTDSTKVTNRSNGVAAFCHNKLLFSSNRNVVFCPPSHSFTSSTSSPLLASSSMHSTSSNMEKITPWYSNPTLKRDRSEILSLTPQKAAPSKSSRFMLFHGKKGVYYLKNSNVNNKNVADPLFLTYNDIIKIFGEMKAKDMVGGGLKEDKEETVLAWVGNQNNLDYWALYLPEKDADYKFLSEELLSNLLLEGNSEIKFEELSPSAAGAGAAIRASPLREIGDTLSSSQDAAILSTANGLLEFHKSHPFCAKCGSRTVVTKAGASRQCTNSECKARTYPRIDIASIMLITSPCEQYALLGRKAFWPKGRYSTLSGFAEVGETLEECCVRETFEESGVVVDPNSVRFVLSQPWPFPRSLMVGFRGKAKIDFKGEDENGLPVIKRCEVEMEDVAWFHKDYVAPRIENLGSTALTYKPSEEEAEFHIPGKASLARVLISQWANE